MPRFSPRPRWIRILWVVLVCLCNGCAAQQHSAVLYSPPGLLNHTTSEMRTAGFWISRHPAPDMVILPPEEITRFNQKIREELKLTKDLSAWPSVSAGGELRATLQKTLDDLQARGLKSLDGKKPAPAYWSGARQAMNIDGIPAEIPRQYGLVVRYADQRFLPLEEGLYARAYDEDFDELQNSALDIGTPVVVLHRSLDGQWLWVESSSSAGWVKAKHVAAAVDEQVRPFWSTTFVVVTVPKGDIYFNRAMTAFAGSLQMGARLPLMRADGDYSEVTVPQRQPDGSVELVPGFIAAEQIHEGYLPYTPRQVLVQAFKMLNQPYGWGGMYQAQDCSRFLQEVFAAVGIELPRDSKNQIQVGRNLGTWGDRATGKVQIFSNLDIGIGTVMPRGSNNEIDAGKMLGLMEAGTPQAQKMALLAGSAVGGITILGMKGHILLYLGSIEGRAYAIHCVWAYRTPGAGADKTYVLNRVVVSDLTLGEGSTRGSLLDRLNAVRIVK
ncbi:MAG: SH3 domain-containing protein [Candidatus Omnitrophica bacterium]|nr:SH3 domain-containing protein [Candidatus Omnitrophota bacterium]